MNSQDSTILYLLSADLFFPSRIQSTASALGLKTQLLTRADSLPELPQGGHLILDMEVPNLDFPQLQQSIEDNHLQCIGYAPHVKTELFQAGKSSGMSKIYTRGQFTEALPEILQTFVSAQE